MKILKPSSKQFERICCRWDLKKRRISATVAKILEDVKINGDEALIKYTKKFDKIKLSARELKITESQISGAYQNIDPNFVATLKVIIENVNRFYRKTIKKSWRIKNEDGVVLGEKVNPVERVGVYVPAGTAPLVSTVYMTVLPAKIAGVSEFVLCSPPNSYKAIDPYILAVADLLKVKNIYKIGGAQAIAAMAYGTKTVPKVDKIVGPGNQYVTEAKRQVFGCVDIDMLAGPTELVIIANKFSNPDYVAADLMAQAEHSGGLAILITDSKMLAKAMKQKVSQGFIILVKNMQQAGDLADKIAPEHLQIMVKNPNKILKRIKNAGAIFIGSYSPVAVGDYVAGPSHVLPTGSTARFFSGLGLGDFLKVSHIISYSKKALEKEKEAIEKIAGIEGLQKHVESVKARFQ